VERGEMLNAGVMLYCRQLDYLAIRTELDTHRLAALDPGADSAEIEQALTSATASCRAASIAGRDERGAFFRWLAAPRSTVIQFGPAHTGLTADPAAEHERLVGLLVRPLPGRPD
jgi:hypothetical protein